MNGINIFKINCLDSNEEMLQLTLQDDDLGKVMNLDGHSFPVKDASLECIMSLELDIHITTNEELNEVINNLMLFKDSL